MSLEQNRGVKFYAMGNNEFNNGNYKAALKFFNLSLRHIPNHIPSLNNKGLALRHLGKIEKAIKYFDTIITKDPKYHLAYYNKAVCLACLKKWVEARELFEKALKIDPFDHLPADGMKTMEKNIEIYHKLGDEEYQKEIESNCYAPLRFLF